jgi:hypothetical protein
MTERNLCSSTKCEALLDWAGLAPETVDAPSGKSSGHLVARAISHVKVSLKGASDVAGKAYLTLAPIRSLQALD